MKILGIALLLGCLTGSDANEAKTAVSLFFASDGKQLEIVQSKKGDLYKQLGHHGPAVENLWAAYRIYFNSSMSVDVLSKFQPRLELADSKWYSLKVPGLVEKNYGKDNFKVAKTVGLGGLRLWDESRPGEDKSVRLDLAKGAGSMRTARVSRGAEGALIRMVSKGVELRNQRHDIEFRLQVFANQRFAIVTARVLNDKALQFATGITVHDQLRVVESKKNYLLAWGDYDSPASSEAFDVGTGLLFDPGDIHTSIRKRDEILIVTKPLKTFRCLISTANEKETSDLNQIAGFRTHLIDSAEFLRNEFRW